MLNMPSSIKKDLRNLSKGDLIKIINSQHNEVMLKNTQIEEVIEDASRQVEELKEMATRMKNEYELEIACLGVSRIALEHAKNHAALPPNSIVVDKELSQGILEENEALKCEIEGLEQNNKILEQEVIKLKLTAKRNKFEGLTGVTHQNKSVEMDLGALEGHAKKAGVEILVVMDRRNGCYPVKRRFADLTRSIK